MDPGGSDLESSLPQPETPCLIVEDSQPDSVALEDDPESSYRALLARRLSSLQPHPRSPVLELTSSPLGSIHSQTDSQSESSQSNNQAECDVLIGANPSSAFQEESQVLNMIPPPNKKKCAPQDTDMESGADSTTHCNQSEEGTSQFGFLELSQSQDLCAEAVNSQRVGVDIAPRPDSERRTKIAEQKISPRTSQSQDNKAVRSEVSSSSSLESPGRSGRQLSVQALLHSQGFQASAEQDQQDCQILSSQEDMFDGDKTGAAVDSTVSEPEQQGHPTPTPAHTLRLLHLSGQGTLVHESLSQSSVDYVAPTPDNFPHTPIIIPSSPTEPENEQGADEPMDTSLPPDDRAGEQDEPMEMEAASKPHPSASTPVSQNSSGFQLKRTLSLPSQPEFSHDVFVPTQSQEAPHQSNKKPAAAAAMSRDTQSQRLESAPFTLPLQLSVNTQSSSPAQCEEDSQATQIEELGETAGVDTSDSVIACQQKSKSNGLTSESQTATTSKASTALTSLGSPKQRGDGAKTEPPKSNPSQKSDLHKKTPTSLNVQQNVNVKDCPKSEAKEASLADVASCSQPKFDSSDLTVNSCVQETPTDTTPCSLPSQSMISQTSVVDVVKASVDSRGGSAKSQSTVSLSQKSGTACHSQTVKGVSEREKVEAEVEMLEEEEESTVGEEASAMGLALSQSQLLSQEPMEESQDSVIIVTESERDSQILRKDSTPQSKSNNSSQSIRAKVSVSTNGHGSQQAQTKKAHVAPDRLSQTERTGPEPEGLKDKSGLSDSSGEISFHFTLPKEGELIGPVVGATPPLIDQLKQTLRHRHSTPIEITSFSEKSDAVGEVSADVAMATSDIVSGESGEDTTEKREGKLSLRMKLVTPVEEGSSERFSLQKPALSGEDESVVKVTAATKAVTSPSVFSRVRQVHRQQDAAGDSHAEGNTPVRAELFASPLRSSQASSLGCSSLPNSQSEPPQPEALAALQQDTPKDPPGSAKQSGVRRGASQAPEQPTPNRTDARERVTQQTLDSGVTSSPSNKLRQRTVSQQTSFDAPGPRSPAGRGEPASPLFRRTSGPSHRRHVRTVQEVRTTVTRIITDVYYEDGKEVERKVSEESEEPVVDCQVLDSDISPCRTGSSSMTSGDLADISSLSSKASSLQHSSGGTSCSMGLIRGDFIMPPSRGAKSASPRRGGGHQQRGHRGHRAGSVLAMDRSYGSVGSPAFVPLSPRGRARRGRPPSRSSLSRGGGVGSFQRLGAHGQPLSSSEDEQHYSNMLPPRLPVSPSDTELPSHSDSLRSSMEEASSGGSSFVGLRVVAKWSSNGYFYSGRIIRDIGESRFRLRFDDGYECEVAGKDILLCDPIPLDTEVTALLEDEYFSIGVVKGHKTEGQQLFYSVEKDGQTQWYNRTAIILSLEQGNKLRVQHSLGPYEPSTPMTKASDISLDNLVEGKRKRREAPSGPNTPNRSSSGSPRTPGPSGKRKMMSSEDDRSPAKRGRRGRGARAAQRVGVYNTSGSGTDLPGQSCDVAETHGPLPQNASLFMGFAFMLTASSEIDRLTNRHSSDDEEDYVQTGPYNKTYTESQLQAGGGFILPDFNEEQCKAAYQSLLIADQHCRTRKYLLCLASGVPCVSHIWVRDCCKDNKLLNYRNYLLPAGVGPDEAIVEWHPRCSPFKALRVLLVFEQPVELWAQLITMGGGSSVRQYQADKDSSDVPAGKYDVVVTDHACPPLVEKNVTSQEVPLVSPEWLIQSVIRGECLGFHSKPQYRHDYSSSSSS